MKHKLIYLSILSLLFITSIAIPLLGASIIADGCRSILIYSRDTDDPNVKEAASVFFSTLAEGPLSWSSDLTLKAEVSLKTEKRASICDVLPLTINSSAQERVFAVSGQNAGGWRPMGMAYGWLPAAKPSNFVNWFSSSALNTQTLTDFDELWIDYQNLFPRFPLNLSAQIFAELQDYSGRRPQRLTAFAGQTILFTAARLEPSKTVWLPKSLSYRVGRYLQTKPDINWRYVGFKDRTVIQRRLHAEISELEYMDFVFSPGSEPLGVNLRLADKDNYSAGMLVELGTLPAVASPYGTLWRLHLPSLLNDRFARKDKVFLQEIIVFVKGAPKDVASTRPLEQIVFQRFGRQDDAYSGAPNQSAATKIRIQPTQTQTRLPLPASFTALNGSIARMIVDLRPLRRYGGVFFKSGKIFLTQDSPAAISALSINNISLVRLCDTKVPTYHSHGESLLKRWGLNNPNTLPAEDGVVWPVMKAYFPFSVFNAQLPKPKTTPDPSLLPLAKQMQALLALSVQTQSYSEIGSLPFALRDKFKGEENRFLARAEAAARPEDRPRLTVSERGVNFSADKPFTKVTSEADGFSLEGAGRRLQFVLPLSADLKPETRLFLSMPEGTEGILSTKLTAVFEDGESSLYIKPNRPEVLGRAGRLKNLSFKMFLTGGPYRLKFNELSLFNPTLINSARAFELKLPEAFKDYPVAEDISAPAGALTSAVKGSFRGSLAPDHSGQATLSWKATARRPIDWLKGIRFSYRVPARTAAANPCWLKLTLAGDKAQITADLCPQDAEGQIFVTPAEIAAGRSDIGRFRGASYKITLGDLSFSPDKDFEFGMSYEGYAMASVVDAFADWPVAMSGGENLDFVKNNRNLKGLIEKRLRLDGDAYVMSKLTAAGKLAPVDHSWFQLDSAVVEPSETFSQGIWVKLTAQSKPVADGGTLFKFMKLILYAVAVMLAWIVIKKVPWRSVGSLAGVMSSLLFGFVQMAATSAWGKAQDYFAVANKIVLFTAVGPGLWYAAGLTGPASTAAQAFCVIAAGGAYWHHRRNIGQMSADWWFASGSCLPPFLKYLGSATALFMVWTAGRARLMPEVRWNLLPALAIVYVFLPWLRTNAAGKIKLFTGMLWQRKIYTLAIFWSAVAIALYGVGSYLPTMGRENYFFTFGALAATFALRYLMEVLRVLIGWFSATLADDISAVPVRPYFAAAILGLVATAASILAGMQPIAEQAAIAVYFCLVIGIYGEGLELYKKIEVERSD